MSQKDFESLLLNIKKLIEKNDNTGLLKVLKNKYIGYNENRE